MLSLLRAQRPLCVRGRLGRGRKRRARGTMGRVKRGSEASFPPFPSSHRPPRAYSYFYWNTTWVPLRRREICVCVASLRVLRKFALSFVLHRWLPPKPQPIEETNQLNTMNFKLLYNLILLYTKASAFLDLSFTLTYSFFLINLAFSLLESMSSAAE